MGMLLYAKDGARIELGAPLTAGAGGGGIVYHVRRAPNMVAKIFRTVDAALTEKMEMMIRLHWSEDVQAYFVFPHTLLYQDAQCTRLAGYTMEKMEGYDKLKDVYAQRNPLSTYKQACVAANLCKAVIAFHRAGKVAIGDFNAKNVLVNRATGAVRIIDTDSMHLCMRVNGMPKIYPCQGLDPEIIIPELVREMQRQNCRSYANLTGDSFTHATDNLCLAYHLHHLLIGMPPYRCVPIRICNIEVSVPSVIAMACRGQYAYSNLPSGTIRPQSYPDFNLLSPQLQSLFTLTFDYGAREPKYRATASDFLPALEQYIAQLRLCHCGEGFDHYIRKGYFAGSCEWCRVQKARNQCRPYEKEPLKQLTRAELKRWIKNAPSHLPVVNKADAYFELGMRYLNAKQNGFLGIGRLQACFYLQCAKRMLSRAHVVTPSEKILFGRVKRALFRCRVFY